MAKNSTKTSAPDLEYPFGSRFEVGVTDWISAGLAFFVGMALQNWSPSVQEDLSFRSTLLIAAIGAFTLTRFILSGHKGWMTGLLISTAAVSAATAVVLL